MNRDRLKKRAREYFLREHAILEGFRLEFNKKAYNKKGVGYANIIRDESSTTEGILYEITEKGIEELGRIEVGYDRIILKVKIDGKTVEAYVYVAQEGEVEGGLKPTKEYLGHLLAGCALLSKDYCEKLKRMSTID
jgi:gamma-glutamylcyclotransferase (GGCT)/AIG2-like uncharacterized protein YtfP